MPQGFQLHRLHGGEQQDVADAVGIGEQHYEAVEAEAQAARDSLDRLSERRKARNYRLFRPSCGVTSLLPKFPFPHSAQGIIKEQALGGVSLKTLGNTGISTVAFCFSIHFLCATMKKIIKIFCRKIF